MLRGVGGVDFLFQVKRRGRGSQADGGDVFLGLVLELLDAFGRLTCTKNHHAGGQRVECSGVSDLHFLHALLAADEISDLVYYAERSPSIGLVDIDDCSFLEIHGHRFTG